jgi:hypothetical protein
MPVWKYNISVLIEGWCVNFKEYHDSLNNCHTIFISGSVNSQLGFDKPDQCPKSFVRWIFPIDFSFPMPLLSNYQVRSIYLQFKTNLEIDNSVNCQIKIETASYSEALQLNINANWSSNVSSCLLEQQQRIADNLARFEQGWDELVHSSSGFQKLKVASEAHSL